jgi:hypothetical protein
MQPIPPRIIRKHRIIMIMGNIHQDESPKYSDPYMDHPPFLTLKIAVRPKKIYFSDLKPFIQV